MYRLGRKNNFWLFFLLGIGDTYESPGGSAQSLVHGRFSICALRMQVFAIVLCQSVCHCIHRALTEDEGLEPSMDMSTAVFKTAALPVRLIFHSQRTEVTKNQPSCTVRWLPEFPAILSSATSLSVRQLCLPETSFLTFLCQHHWHVLRHQRSVHTELPQESLFPFRQAR